MSGFTIARIGTIVFRAPVGEPVVTSFGAISDRVSVLVRVEDEDGAHGWGDVWCNFPSYGAEHRGLVLHRTLAPMALGRAVDDPAALWRELAMRTHVLALQSGDAGAFSAALAGLDAALWDLKARRAGLPLARLLGGAVRDVPVYASGLNPGDGPDTVERARAEGYRRFKQKIGFGEEVDLPNLRRIASGLREGEVLLVDAADRPEEEWRLLAEAYAAPLAGGENLRGQDLLRAASDPWLGVVQPDVGKWGGVSGCLAVGQAAVEAGKRYCPHWLSGGIGLMASAHLLSAVGGAGMLEVDSNPNPLRASLAQPFPALVDGAFALTDAPGIGAEPDMGAARPFLVARNEAA
jgi:D-galactarolactone cycloisomerase